ncbi:hypothetical protein EZJ43_08175 [Pedobacter changchengzhani]|uniref:Uncharacterized protein n=1 Tax=Pedobacter changchengzhani TaxID=2529274 RepID=A0A4R5MMH4_9SPHI|nr:hypothetical protein [Pedobacter changchengzhani]TDG36485.1 hypothetical protein EZJ43_08175 [Pedobacter changchengzhani]
MNTINNKSTAHQQYHAIAKHWASDVEFFKVETVFLHHLLDDYFIRLSDPEHLQGLNSVGLKLMHLEKDKFSVDHHLIDHLKNLEGQTEDLDFNDGELLAKAHGKLEQTMAQLTNNYRLLKTELFTLVQKVIKAQNDALKIKNQV